MSRFTETLERNLEVIADRATPSPDAWEQIQSRIADQEPIQETEIIMLTENTLTRRRWPLVAAAAAVVALAIGAIALVNRDDGVEQPADVPEPTPTVAPAPEPETGADEQQDAVDDVSPLPAEGEALPSGRYAPFTLGLPVAFEVPADTVSPWTVQVSNPVTINVGNADGFVVLTRVGSLYDAEQAQLPEMIGLGSIPPDDVDGWIDANGVVVVESRDETVGGRNATFRQVTAPPGAGDATELCPAEQRPCLSVGSASADLQDTYDGVSMALFGQNAHSFWFVELEDFEPLAIWSSAVAADQDDWFAEMLPMIESIELGDPAPATEFGRARLSTFDPGIPEETVATGSYEAVRISGEPLADGSVPASTTMSIQGDVAGEATGVGTTVIEEAGVSEEGVDEFTFTGTIDGVGTGTVTWTLDWQLVNGIFSSTGLVTGGTGDFAGATGTTTTSIQTIGEDGESAGTITFYFVLE